MDLALLKLAGIALMVGALLLIPLGLPGLWLMVAVLVVGAMSDAVGWGLLAALVLLVLAAEVLEFLAVSRLSSRYGGSKWAFWGALAGGFAGVVVGLPVPVVGSLVAGVLGTFAGAALVSLWETRQLGAASRVGWGAMLGRVVAVGVKVAVGIAVLLIGGAALLFP
jgi:uncharacterized protein YqgC (DUF456 family)